MANNNNHIIKIFMLIRKWVWEFRFHILAVLVPVEYCLIVSRKTMPFAEGWYTYYAQCINNGEAVYKDFDYLFTPVYIYLISFITKIFGYRIIVLRLLGVLFFGIIACVLFLICKEIIAKRLAVVASVTAALFLQTEAAQVFYDYIRLMDIFALLSTLFLIKYTKHMFDIKKRTLFISCAGVANSLFVLIKQNMGIMYAVYALILIISLNLVLKEKTKKLIRDVLLFIIFFVIPIFLVGIMMLRNESLYSFLNQTGYDAIQAKGGISVILFNWLFNNRNEFVSNIINSLVIIILLFIMYFINFALCKKDKMSSKKSYDFNAYVYSFSVASGVFAFIFCSKFANFFLRFRMPNIYGVFEVVLIIFVLSVTKVLFEVATNRSVEKIVLPVITFSGAYLTISYGCGMSGGLAAGQSAMGIALIIVLFLDVIKNNYLICLKYIITVICIVISLQCCAEKMFNMYNWWGMNEVNYWESDKKTDKIKTLQGIKMSDSTLEVYETVYDIVNQYTTPNDTILCFPQIPIFYTICDRKDPGLRDKVQWFDVASDNSIDNDMKIIENNPPRVVIIYDTFEETYNAHERLFRGGEISATRRMKRFLLDYVTEHNYTYLGTLSNTENNIIRLYVNEDRNYLSEYQMKGKGTFDNPYLVSSIEDLLWIKKSVDNGNDYSGVYFSQTQDIDLSGITSWTSIGETGSGKYFRGVYDGQGYAIKNLHYSNVNADVGFFGTLGGIVCNLAIVNCEFQGNCSGIIASRAENSDSIIINCYTDSKIDAYRAGGIADDFVGKIINCVSYSECLGFESAGAISYTDGFIENVYALGERCNAEVKDSYGNSAVKYVTKKYMQANQTFDILNDYVEQFNCRTTQFFSEEIERRMGEVQLKKWIVGENKLPVLSTF